MKLHEKIYYCRKKSGLSQDALAEKLGISRQAISKWETGESVPETGKLVALASALGVTVDWLLSEDEPEAERGREADSGVFVPGMEAAAAHGRGVRDGLRRWCWLAGVLVAVVGAYIAYRGIITKVTMSRMLGILNMTGSPDTPITLNGVDMALGDFLENNPVATVSTIWLVGGIALIVAGVLLAVFLKRRFAK